MRRIRACVAGVLCAAALASCSGNDVNQALNTNPSAPPSQSAPTEVAQLPATAVMQPTQSDSTAAATEPAGGQVQPAALQQTTAVPQGAQQGLSQQEQTINNVYTRVAPAVVRIETGQGLGSGFVVDTEGHIITNNHVVEGAQGGQVRVSFTGLFETIGQVVGADSDSDIAVVKVDKLPEGVQPVELGDSSKLVVGQTTIAIGNPLAQDRTVTTGIVSALGRTIDEQQQQQQQQQGGYSIGGAIQTDAAINPGNSGGPLLNTSAQVIGMDTAILSQSGTSSGIGFAIPSNLIKKVSTAIIKQGSYQHPYLGVTLQQVTTLAAQQNNLPSAGVLIRPAQGGPVAKAGITGQAIMTAINGQDVTSPDDVISYLELNTNPGDTVTLSIVEGNGQKRDVQVQVGSRPRAESQQ
ncbi:MAG TPA: trypsin-like peptidase domain-containing protein [Roseiflexaceae bacterium]|nr:trypsin-like peptidase domain-containing protein [Roseiflexaceae bacterium]